jgi:TPR repeat protein
LKLFEESANEGFEFAFFKLIEFYSKGEFKDIDTAEYWLDQARKRGFDESCFARLMKEAQDAQNKCGEQ